MNTKRVRKAEQVELIMECRRSGLSDYQWCQNHGIHPGTFYNWVSILRKAGYQILDSESRTAALPVTQEVVKLKMVESTLSTPVKMEQNVSSVQPPLMISVTMVLVLSNQISVGTPPMYSNIATNPSRRRSMFSP